MSLLKEDPSVQAGRRPVITLWLFRVAALIHLLVACCLPLLIGQYFDGRFSMLAWHSTLGSMLVAFTMLMGAAAIAYVIAGGRVWVLPALLVLYFAEGLQIGMGYARVLAIHVPLGVLIVTVSIALFGWLWMPSARRARSRRTPIADAGPGREGTS